MMMVMMMTIMIMAIKWNTNVQYSDIMRFLVRHNRHHKVSRSLQNCYYFLRIRVRGHFVMSIVMYLKISLCRRIGQPSNGKQNKKVDVTYVNVFFHTAPTARD